ncbi:uncharacterized protein CDAR_41941 [Caerostris darwini]|uniref:Uncharacterized protein n=1 Tax=Caerostris darwini TaxID=1538125 RepID=A0AAV4V3H8_9ARAC|nr:uncharacterized protein CDAR_41941 [Caerostris darwini]
MFTTQKCKYIIVILLVLHFKSLKSYVLFDKHECKSTEEDNKCVFNFSNGNWEELLTLSDEFDNCLAQCDRGDILFHFKNYSLPAFKHTLFSNFKDRNLILEISNGSRVALLSPSLPEYSLFANSTFSSLIFDISDAITLVGWNWTLLENITIVSDKGFEFNAVKSKLIYLHSDFNKIARGRITIVRILECGLRWLGRNVFAPLVHLKILEFRDNFLENIERSQLPSSTYHQAPALRYLDLGNNRLTSLPDDLFEDLNLQIVYLDGNRLKISEPLMETILNNERQYIFTIEGVWPCNCDISVLGKIENSGKQLKDMECYENNGSGEEFNYEQKCKNQLIKK